MTEYFAPHKTCERPDTCGQLGQCQRALVIEDEINHVKDGTAKTDRTPRLVIDPDIAKCKHPQALRKITEGKILVKNNGKE